jgi:hypothetical protein
LLFITEWDICVKSRVAREGEMPKLIFVNLPVTDLAAAMAMAAPQAEPA